MSFVPPDLKDFPAQINRRFQEKTGAWDSFPT